jgi:Glyoxalase-like domain
MFTRIDHLMICVPDLAKGTETYRRLGFNVQPGGTHPGKGTHNAIMFNDEDYLELLAIHDPAEDRAGRRRGGSVATGPSTSRRAGCGALVDGVCSGVLRLWVDIRNGPDRRTAAHANRGALRLADFVSCGAPRNTHPLASMGFRLLWCLKSRPGRPAIPVEPRQLIGGMAAENPLWGEERIANELLLKLGLRVSPSTVRKYMPKRPPGRPRGDQRW